MEWTTQHRLVGRKASTWGDHVETVQEVKPSDDPEQKDFMVLLADGGIHRLCDLHIIN